MAAVSTARLLVLGVLARHGAMHGYDIRRWVEQRSMDEWADIKVGALYGAINRLAAEGLIAETRSERQGRLPARTIYDITEEGRAQLDELVQRAVVDVNPPPDPFDVAMAVADLDRRDLAALLHRRRARLTAALDDMLAELDRDRGRGHLGPVEILSFRHAELLLRAEIQLVDEFEAQLPAIARDRARRRRTAR
jgi:DNA-binding PadR family transcriptional regulator